MIGYNQENLKKQGKDSVAMNKKEAFLFVHFTDTNPNTPMSEQIYFSVSKDGLNWKTLNGKKPIITSEIGEKGIRDPFIIRAKEGNKFYMVGTDLNVFLRPDHWGSCTLNGSHDILVWESDDLVNWSETKAVTVAREDAGCAWAPETIYDREKDSYMVFWASRVDFGKGNHKLFRAYTKDFKTFTPAEVYIERECDVIDTDIVEHNGTYYRFSKDETSKCILMEKCSSLSGKFEVVNSNLSEIHGVEGPQCCQLPDGRWCLFLDQYGANAGYAPFVTDDLDKGQFEKVDGQFHTDIQFRHGGVLTISTEEYDRLVNAFN